MNFKSALLILLLIAPPAFAGSTAISGSNSDSTAIAGANSSASQGQGQQQGQQQGQGQGQQQGIRDSGNSGATAGGGSVQGNQLMVSSSTSSSEAAHTAAATGVTVMQSDSCAIGVGAAAQGLTFGFSVTGTNKDENCERIKLWRELRGAGYNQQALLLLQQDPRVAKAFQDALGQQHTALAPNQVDGKTLVEERYASFQYTR